MVVKKNGRKSSFDRDKLAKSIYIALKKRPIDTDTVEKLISNISRNLEEMGQSEEHKSHIRLADSLPFYKALALGLADGRRRRRPNGGLGQQPN